MLIYEYALARGKIYISPYELYDADGNLIVPPMPALCYTDADNKGNTMPGPAHTWDNKRRPRYVDWEEIAYGTPPVSDGVIQ